MKKSKLIIVLSSGVMLTACQTMPTSGASQRAIISLSDEQLPKVDVVEVDNQVTTALSKQKEQQSFRFFDSASQRYQGAVQVGDVLDITIWEAPPAVLFGGSVSVDGSGGATLTKLPEQVVSQSGRVSIPFLGAITVRGQTPEQIQRNIEQRLTKIANNPQVVVRLIKNNSANVTVLRQGNGIRMPLTGDERVLDAVAAVGGVNENLQDVSVQLTRNGTVKTISLESLSRQPSENIKLVAGDVVTLWNNPLSFTAMGAVGSNREVRFSAKGLTLAEAIGKMGGLIDNRADPKGIFVFRYLPFERLSEESQSVWAERGYYTGTEIPTVYRANLLDPNALFWLQRFPIEDKDILYVSNAPLAEFNKFLRMIFSVSTPTITTIEKLSN